MMMNFRQTIIVASAAMLMLNAPALQAASITQTLFNSISQSLATLSNSSAKSSTNAANDLGQINGDYEITRIAAAEGSNDRMQIALRAPGDDRERDINLFISAADYNNIDLGVGQVVTATQHAYGVAFTRGDAATPFTVVLADAWVKDLGMQAVAL
jgi:hypothetical protein